jgi:hypothetical protein
VAVAFCVTVIASLSEAADGASVGAMVVAASADGGDTWKDGAIAALTTALLTSALFGCLGKKREPRGSRGSCGCSCDGCREHCAASSNAGIVVFDVDGSGGGSYTIDAAADFLRRNAAEATAAVPPMKAAAAAARLSRQQALEALSENTFTKDQLLFKTEVRMCVRSCALDWSPTLLSALMCMPTVCCRVWGRGWGDARVCAWANNQSAYPWYFSTAARLPMCIDICVWQRKTCCKTCG